MVTACARAGDPQQTDPLEMLDHEVRPRLGDTCDLGGPGERCAALQCDDEPLVSGNGPGKADVDGAHQNSLPTWYTITARIHATPNWAPTAVSVRREPS